jgi:hypothetical protein
VIADASALELMRLIAVCRGEESCSSQYTLSLKRSARLSYLASRGMPVTTEDVSNLYRTVNREHTYTPWCCVQQCALIIINYSIPVPNAMLMQRGDIVHLVCQSYSLCDSFSQTMACSFLLLSSRLAVYIG